MIRMPSHLLVAVLLAVGGCKLSTSDLAPKTDADCGANEKACGYKCVGVDDPTSGCGERGCSPCPSIGPNTVAACTELLECGYVCSAGWGDCNGDPVADGCETRLVADVSNCGACGRSCGSAACTAGECGSEWLSPWNEPRGIVSRGEVVYWVEAGGTGDVYRWDPAVGGGVFVRGNAQHIATGLDPDNTNAVYRLSAYPEVPNLFASGATSGGDLAIYAIDTTTAAAVSAAPMYSKPGSSTLSMIGLAVLPTAILFTTDGDGFVHYFIDATTDGMIPTASSAPLHGVTAFQGLVYFGYPGTLSYVNPASVSAGEYGVFQVLSSSPSRIAIFADGVGGEWFFWADERDGSVWSQARGGPLYQADPGSGSQTQMDIAADRWGVVWSNAAAGRVSGWRASDGALFDLPTGGGMPLGVALTDTHVYWTEASPDGVLRVPK